MDNELVEASPGSGRTVRQGLGALLGPGRRIAVLLAWYVVARLLSVVGIAVAHARSDLGWVRAFRPWDGDYYRNIVLHGYPGFVPAAGQSDLARAAFFPGYPLLVRAVTSTFGTPVVATGVVLNLLLGALTVVLVHAAARHELAAGTAYRAALLFVALPGGVVFVLVQSDPLLVALCAAGIVALQHRRWVAAGLLGAAATATRPNGFGLVAAAAVAAWLAVRRDRDLRSLWAVGLAPLGALGYWAYLWWHTGVPNAWFVIQDRFWHQRLDFGVTFLYALKNPGLLAENRTYLITELGFVLLALAALAWYRGARMGPVAWAYTLVLVAQMLLFGGVGPRPRFLLVAFPLTWLVAQRFGDRWLWLLGGVLLAAQPVLAWLYSAQLAIP